MSNNFETENNSLASERSNNPIKVANDPKQLGRYEIIQEVGRGATAFVYKAYDPELDRHLAIKILRHELASDEDYRDAFIREARLAAQLTHPGIVTIFDVGIAEGKPYIAMELLEGVTLEKILKTQGKLKVRTVLAMSLQLSSALKYAHQQGVIHRDIKPANIVVLKDKKTVKLTDFGIAQFDNSLANLGKSSDKVLGTPEYMAPEQILGKAMDNRSDLYSFGVLIYQLLVGHPPFSNADLGILFKQIVKSKPPELVLDDSPEDEKVKDDFNDLIRKLLQKRIDKRFNNAALVSSELRNIQTKIGAKKKNINKGFISLKLRWTAIMAGAVFIAMCISLAVVYFVQNKALSGITFDYARSIARMIAYESSEPILLDDSIGLNALVLESSKNEQLKSVFVMALDNTILASTEETNMIGKSFVVPLNRELKQSFENSVIYQRQLADKNMLFDIEMPILYGNKNIGHLYVSFSANSMISASKTTLVTMLTVMIITLFVIFLVTLALARQASMDYIRVTLALRKVTLGNTHSRLISKKNDEAGQLFSAFNQLAEYLEVRFDNKNKAD